MTRQSERKTHEERYREMKERKKEQADVNIPVESGDRVKVFSMSGIHEWMLEEVGGFPIEGTVTRVDYKTEGCRNLSCEAVVRVKFTQDECPAVYNGTTEIYPIGGIRDSWEESNVEAL